MFWFLLTISGNRISYSKEDFPTSEKMILSVTTRFASDTSKSHLTYIFQLRIANPHFQLFELVLHQNSNRFINLNIAKLLYEKGAVVIIRIKSPERRKHGNNPYSCLGLKKKRSAF